MSLSAGLLLEVHWYTFAYKAEFGGIFFRQRSSSKQHQD